MSLNKLRNNDQQYQIIRSVYLRSKKDDDCSTHFILCFLDFF